MSKHFSHLHLHTEYSLLDGAIKIPDLVKTAKKNEWQAIGISDHGNIFGAVKFFQMARKEKIKPILGAEMYFTTDIGIKDAREKYYHLILIVQNKTGYKNLCRLMAYAHQEGFYFKPRIDYAILEKYSEGLIASTACLGGHIPKLLVNGNIDEAKSRASWFKDLFGKDRFFFELAPSEFAEQTTLNTLLSTYSNAWEIPCIATADSHYLCHDDREAHEVLLAVQTKDVMSNPDRYTFGESRVWVRSTEEMLKAFPEQQDIIWNTGLIADQCDFNFDFDKFFFPKFAVPETYTEETFFEFLCKKGLQRLHDEALIPQEHYARYEARLDEEVGLIKKMGFVGYFLVVSDFILWAKERTIPVGPGRGSAAGSLVAWTLQITNVDPLKYNLLFERFLNPERISMPDIDIDFCVERREDVINYVKERYGHDCVCQIITFGTMMAKGVIKDVARTLGFPFQDSNALTELIPNNLKITLKEAIEQEPRLKHMIDTNHQVKRLFDISFKLEGLTRHASKHAAGIVISPEPLVDTLPLYIPPKSTDLVAQYAMAELESIGFLKMDFLGLKNLTVIDRALKAIQANYNLAINLDKLSLDDPKVFALLSEGKTNAIFQFESDGIKEVLRKLKPDKFEDLIAVNALYRPGPLGAGMVEDYIERRHGRQKVTYLFSELEPILQETYGIIVYQEQVMKIAATIASYTLGAANILMKAMGKKKADVMEAQRKTFIEGAINNKFDEKKAGELFDLMAHFAGYGFNKSHSTAYALIAYHTAYLKTHYPHEFMAASVSFETNDPEQLTHYLQEIHDLNLETIQPNLNRSEIEFVARDQKIIFGLQGIKNLGHAAIESIIEERQKGDFVDLLDFCKRVDLRTVNKRVIESLIYAGATDIFPGNRAQKIAELEKIIALAHDHKTRSKTGQVSLFDNVDEQTDTFSAHLQQKHIYVYQPLNDWPIKEKLDKEKEAAGFYLSAHPLKSYPILSWLTTETFSQAHARITKLTSPEEPHVVCTGLVQSKRVIMTKKGDRMAFMHCEDQSSSCELIVFPRVFQTLEPLLDKHHVFLIFGTLDITATSSCKIKANRLIPVEQLMYSPDLFSEITLSIPPHYNDELGNSIIAMLPPGTTRLSLRFHENNQPVVLKTKKKVSLIEENLQKLSAQGLKILLTLS